MYIHVVVYDYVSYDGMSYVYVCNVCDASSYVYVVHSVCVCIVVHSMYAYVYSICISYVYSIYSI